MKAKDFILAVIFTAYALGLVWLGAVLQQSTN